LVKNLLDSPVAEPAYGRIEATVLRRRSLKGYLDPPAAGSVTWLLISELANQKDEVI
jgi:hypothetical protein